MYTEYNIESLQRWYGLPLQLLQSFLWWSIKLSQILNTPDHTLNIVGVEITHPTSGVTMTQEQHSRLAVKSQASFSCFFPLPGFCLTVISSSLLCFLHVCPCCFPSSMLAIFPQPMVKRVFVSLINPLFPQFFPCSPPTAFEASLSSAFWSCSHV